VMARAQVPDVFSAEPSSNSPAEHVWGEARRRPAAAAPSARAHSRMMDRMWVGGSTRGGSTNFRLVRVTREQMLCEEIETCQQLGPARAYC
jgi:hypothetical protein